MGDLPESGATAELKPLASNSTSFKKNWGIADRAIREIIRKVQPTSVSEEKRRDVIDYIQRLIRNYLGAEVLPYGSVPLKTYLPDGDIDLTAFGGGNAEDTLADDMKSILKGAGEFAVKDVQLIRAEVKLVKCIVQDIVVDVSFNQIGGLCTLCFLEQVDRFISKDHLFKHSIILIKAWCYYESRILGAHHGLISTYALETLVLYIFHFFHSILDGPLAVLYKFLDYFSKFDWETYCISLNGPIRLSSLPAIIAEIPEGSDRELLLTSDFLSSCVGTFSVPSRGSDTRGFQRKHLNIVDPLKENNNLGRSVSQGNFYRIRSAFSLGARKLTRILQQPEDTIDNELQRFFSNTTGRHGGGQRHDIRDFNLDPSLVHNSLVSAVPIPVSGLRKIDYSDEHTISSGDFQSGLGKSSQDLLKGTENISDIANLEQYNSSLLKHPSVLPDRDHSPKPNGLDSRLHGDSTDLATSGLGDLKISTDLLTGQSPSSKESGNAVIKPYFAPHLYFPNSKWHDHNTGDGNSDSDKLDKCKKNASSLVSLGSDEGRVAVVGSLDENHLVDRDEPVASSKAKDAVSATKSSSSSVDHNHTDPGQGSASRSETHESSNSFDLTGDYDSFMQCLQYGRWFYDYGLGMHSLPMPPLPIPPYRNSLWDGIVPLSYKQNGFSHRHHNGFHPSPPLYPVQPVLLPGVAFGWEEVPKPRGTGTYFPNTNQPPLGYRSSSMKGRNQAPSRSPRNNGRNIIFVEPNMIDRSSYELSQPQLPLDRSMMISSPDSYLSYSPHGNGYPNANGLFIQPEAVVEFELVGHAPGTPSPEQNRQQRTAASSSPRTLSGMQRSQSAFREQDRISLRSSYHLKDEDDFPPLPV